jgi:hypothetical protein
VVSREPGAAGREPGRRPERPRRRPQPGRGRPRHRRTDCAPVGDRGGTDTPRDRTCCPDAGGGQHHAAGTDTGHAADHVGDLQRGRVRPCSDSADSSSMSTEIVPSATTIPAPATTQSSTATDAGQPGTASSDWPPTPTATRTRPGQREERVPRPLPPVPLHPRTDEPAERPEGQRQTGHCTSATPTANRTAGHVRAPAGVAMVVAREASADWGERSAGRTSSTPSAASGSRPKNTQRHPRCAVTAPAIGGPEQPGQHPRRGHQCVCCQGVSPSVPGAPVAGLWSWRWRPIKPTSRHYPARPSAISRTTSGR